ncbi:MarR family transcriptional regulator [soil metagenome]
MAPLNDSRKDSGKQSDCSPAPLTDAPLNPAAEALRDFYLRSHRVLDRLMASQGASLAKTKLMLFIHKSGSVRSTDLVEAFGFAPRTITEAVDALERDGLAERIADPDDRRAKRISLTRAGRGVLESTAPLRRQFGDELLSVLSAAETKQLTRLIGRLNQRLDEMTQARESDER